MIFLDPTMATELATFKTEFHPAFTEAELEAKQLGSKATMQWRARMSDGQTVHMSVIYPYGVAKLGPSDYQASILKQLRMRFSKVSPVSVYVDRLTYEARPQQQHIQIL